MTPHSPANGDLLAEAERVGFDVVLTADKNMRYQQNLRDRKISLVVLSTPQWPIVRLHIEKIAAALEAATPGSYAEVEIPVHPPTQAGTHATVFVPCTILIYRIMLYVNLASTERPIT
ncbi:MAG: hypothetical protein ACRD3T_04460 [Terriglobia bacterium]